MLDVNAIQAPNPTGYVDLAYHPGYFYAAYRSTNQVHINNLLWLNLICKSAFKVPTVTMYPARPVGLIYHNHLYHLMDIYPFQQPSLAILEVRNETVEEVMQQVIKSILIKKGWSLIKIN